jgi:Delta24-sterol reductase
MPPHEELVESISAPVKAFYDIKNFPFESSTARRSASKCVDISLLSNIFTVDTSSATAIVEPNVPLDTVVQATPAHGMIPPVVMEFPGITVGGGHAGSAGESNSFKHGFFDETVRSVEILPVAEVSRAPPLEHPVSHSHFDHVFVCAKNFLTSGFHRIS